MTGLEPEDHGVWGFRNFHFVNSRLEYELNNSSSMLNRNLWRIISAYNKKVCVINLPLTYPAFEINGIMVSGFPVPAENGDKCTYPKDFLRELVSGKRWCFTREADNPQIGVHHKDGYNL